MTLDKPMTKEEREWLDAPTVGDEDPYRKP
jgi:hypothetical protein